MTQPSSRSALPAETGHWWALALRGAVAILFGIAAFLRPDITLEALILLFGAYALVDGVFAIVCFYVHPVARRHGVARVLVRAAVEHASARGATAVEAYAADGLGGTSSTDFMGVKDWFLDEGFHPVRRARSKTVVRRDLV